MEISLDFLTNKLIEKDIRPSYQRIRVLEYLYQKDMHPTVDDIYTILSSEIPSLSKTTIYNTLHTFVDAGLVQIVGIDESELRYDLKRSPHGHFICEACSIIIDFAIDIDRFPYEGLNQFIIKEKNVYFKGLCPNCLSILSQDNKE